MPATFRPAFRPGLCSVTFRTLPPEAVVRLAAAAGIVGIEWGGDVHVSPGDLARARAVREMTEAAGLDVSSYGSYLAPPTDGLHDFQTVLETARALGAPHVRIWPGTRGRDSADYTKGERSDVAALIAGMGRRAAASGVTLGLEFHPQSLTDTAGSAAALMAEIDVPEVFLYWQPRPGLTAGEAVAEIALLGRDVCHLHVFAWDAGKRRYPLVDQADSWRRMMDAIPPGRWMGRRYAMLEFVRDDDPGQFARDAETLCALCG